MSLRWWLTFVVNISILFFLFFSPKKKVPKIFTKYLYVILRPFPLKILILILLNLI